MRTPEHQHTPIVLTHGVLHDSAECLTCGQALSLARR